MRKAPRPGEPGGQHKPIGNEWTIGHESVLKDMKQAILSDPILQRPDVNRRFYLKTDYSSRGYGAALCQADASPEAKRAESEEEDGGLCQFDRKISSLRLHPILFESKAVEGPHQSDHSHMGELKAGDFAMQKFRPFLWGKEFTWIADCMSLKGFFEQRDMPNHQMERLRMRMLCFQFTVVHRNAGMVREADLLSRYNRFAHAFRNQTTESQPQTQVNVLTMQYNQPIGSTNIPVQFVGPSLAPRSEAAKRWAREMTVILGTAGFGEVEQAIRMIGQQPVVVAAVEADESLNKMAEHRLNLGVHTSTEELLQHLHHAEEGKLAVDAYIATCYNSEPNQTIADLEDHLNDKILI